MTVSSPRIASRRMIRRAGFVSVMSLFLLGVIGAVSIGVAMMVQQDQRVSQTQHDANQAHAAAESGLALARWRLSAYANEILDARGTVDAVFAEENWAQLADRIMSDMAVAPQFEDQPTHPIAVRDTQDRIQRITLGEARMSPTEDAPTFQITFAHHPLVDAQGAADWTHYEHRSYQRDPYALTDGHNEMTDNGMAVSANNPISNRWVRVSVVGRHRGIERHVHMDFQIDKKLRYAIFSRHRIMIGRNVMIQGPVGSHYTLTQYKHGHPIQMRDNFHRLHEPLDAELAWLTGYLAQWDRDGDNRIAAADAHEMQAWEHGDPTDLSGDGYIETFDLMLGHYDANLDGRISQSEFSDGGVMHDAQLWQLIQEAKYPPGTQINWDELRIQLPDDGYWIDASEDLRYLDATDDYAKIAGAVAMRADRTAWEEGAAQGDYHEALRGSIRTPSDTPALTFNASDHQLASFRPDSFDTAIYRDLAEGNFATQTTAPQPHHAGLPAEFTPPSDQTREPVPLGSPYAYDHYDRPIYRNMVFRDVKIPKGTNALFVDCKFIGVTFVETENDNTDPNFNYAGTQDEHGEAKFLNVEAEVEGQPHEDTKSLSNNLRFHDCVFEGVLASDTPQAYSHVRNKVQLTGKTHFDVQAESLTPDEQALFRKSSIMMPQFSVDVGSFTEPNSAAESIQLDGTIVTGVLDVRGQARIDGSIITTFSPTPGAGPLTEGGNPAAFNTTLGYFESSAGDSEAEMPTGGYGKILLRYDPQRELPDGILSPIECRADVRTYWEGAIAW